MKWASCAIATIFTLSSAAAQEGPTALHGPATALQRSLITDWQRLNKECRGGAGDNPATDQACQRRTTVANELAAQGCSIHPGDYWTCR